MTAAARVAVLGDVHGNVLALAAVLEELRGEDVELVVWTGDLSWGAEPTAVLDLVRALDTPSLYVRGNAERALVELRDGVREAGSEREQWMLEHHSPDDLDFAASFEGSLSVDIEGLGPTFFTHGSPRSDEELLTAETPEARVAAATEGISERVLVTGHTHSQYNRDVAGVHALNPGSIGMPYEHRPGAYWALLGPEVELRRTEYDVAAAADRLRASGFPDSKPLVETLLQPPTPAEMIKHAEQLEFSG